ncbi:DUF2867 domain-containing protein [bacterium]|nr:DUF2867 domain-containing protein [bacterium]
MRSRRGVRDTLPHFSGHAGSGHGSQISRPVPSGIESPVHGERNRPRSAGISDTPCEALQKCASLPDEVIYSFEDPTFRSHISIFLDRNAQQVIFGNRIQFKNRLGKWYFTCIRPLHERVITTLLNRLQEDPDGT